jgi:putative endopeptidase
MKHKMSTNLRRPAITLGRRPETVEKPVNALRTSRLADRASSAGQPPLPLHHLGNGRLGDWSGAPPSLDAGSRSAPVSRSWPIRLVLAFALASAACADASASAVPDLPPEMDPLVRNLDPTVRPGDDFFRHANGTWLKQNPIPPAERGWGLGNLVIEQVRSQLLAICEDAARANAPKGSVEQLVGDFWVAGMDSVAIERQGIEPLRPDLDRIDAIRTPADLLAAIARQQTLGAGPLYSSYVWQDERKSTEYILHLYQGGLGLPDRDYYLLDDSTTVRVREAYLEHIATMIGLLGMEELRAAAAARGIMDLETALARASRTLEELRDPYANYNKVSMAELDRWTPRIEWSAHLRAQGVPLTDSIVVGQPEFFAAADSLLAAAPLDTWKDYLRWGLVNTFAACLNRAVDLQDFRFYGQLLEGRQAQRPRWKRVLDAEENGIGELMGQIWVRRHCSPATKARYEKLVDDFFATYAERIRRLEWMSEPTKEKALAKLARVGKKVAYPDRWKDFSELELDRSSYATNQMRVNQWWFRHEASKIGQPIDRTEWDMTPQTYNAYYNGSSVEIVLPAGVFLVPGLPDSLMDDAILYANAGAATIGHEITHGFDDEGRQYDAEGNLNPWWTSEDSTRFAERAKILVEQFDQYVVGGRNVRGEATLGENISDLGGLVIGYEAFKKTEQWKRGEKLNGLTPDQRFFLAFAFAWMGQHRPEYLDQLIMSDVHSPSFLRVNGPLANVTEFYETFKVEPGDAMYRPEHLRVKIW